MVKQAIFPDSFLKNLIKMHTYLPYFIEHVVKTMHFYQNLKKKPKKMYAFLLVFKKKGKNE